MADLVRWGPKRRDFFAQFARFEIDRALGARTTVEQKWRDWLVQYRAHPEDGIAHFPFEGAHRETVPVSADNVDPIWASYMANIHGAENIWTMRALSEKWVNAAKPLQDFTQWLDVNQLHMWDVNMQVLPNMVKLGTAVYKTGWRFEQRRTWGYDEQLNRVRRTQMINAPLVDQVNIVNLLTPPEAREIDPDVQHGALWVGERLRIRPPQLRAMARGQEPFLPNFLPEAVTTVMRWVENSLTEEEAQRNVNDRVGDSLSGAFFESREIELWEMHVRFDTTGDGIEEDIIVTFHKPTATILRAIYNWLPGGRPYSVVRYLRGDGFFGIGVCEQTETWQNVISNVLNYDLDKLLLTNAPMFVVREGANILPDEPIFPGKIWSVLNPKEDILPMHMVAPGNFDIMQMMGFLQEQSRARTGLNELQQANISSLPSRTPATTVQSLLQEGNTRFDMSIKDLRQGGLSEVGLRVLQNLQFQTKNFTNNPFAQAYLATAQQVLGEPEGQEAVRAITGGFPAEPIQNGIGVQLTATSGLSNKELQKQSNLALLQLGSQMGEQFINLAALIQQGGLVGEVATKLFSGGTELLLRTLEQFDVRNPEEIVPNIQTLLQANQQLAGGGNIQPLGGAAGGAPGGASAAGGGLRF